MPNDCGLRSGQRSAPGREIIQPQRSWPRAFGTFVTLHAPSLANNLSQFYRTHTESKAGQARPAKTQAATASQTSTRFQGPAPFSGARTQGRGGQGSRWLGSGRSLYHSPVNPWLSRLSVLDPTAWQPGKGRTALPSRLSAKERT